MQKILTPREYEIAQLVTRGMSNRAIAASLCVSTRTVENHLYAAYSKLGVKSRTELAFSIYSNLVLPAAV